jgi:hypothetical protein
MAWNDGRKTLSLRLEPGSKMLQPAKREIRVQAGSATRDVVFEGRNIEVRF